MLVLRPICGDDFAALKQIATESGHGFTSLPVDDEQLQAKIARAEASFNKQVNGPGDEGYLFVLEDTYSGQIVGTSGLKLRWACLCPYTTIGCQPQCITAPA